MTTVEPVRLRGRYSTATLYCADCLTLLPLDADAVITDQPYGTGWIRGGGKRAGQFQRRKETAEWDAFALTWMEHAPATLASFCPIQGVWEMCLRLRSPCILKYRKRNPTPMGADCEPIVCSRPPKGDWEREVYNGDNEFHPCQKPVPLMAWLVCAFSEAGQTVLDPFMGSGSTGVACVRTHRHFVGIERDPRHFDNAVRRIQREIDHQLI